MKKKDLENMREEYHADILLKKDFHKNPMQQFTSWFQFALEQGVPEPNAFTLATVDQKGQPSNRVVLIKAIRENGIVFYTNYTSKKASDITNNPQVAASFFWQQISRQVRIQGICEKISSEESDIYFRSRPLESQIGAITSPQSMEIESRRWLMEQWEINRKQLGEHPQRPNHWGGYLIVIHQIEFWQGQPGRLHDRLQYVREGEGWQMKRLAP